jgi:hypothetical protein
VDDSFEKNHELINYMGLNLHKLGLRKNKRKENQTRSKGTFKV